jgi:hypothetical protein
MPLNPGRRLTLFRLAAALACCCVAARAEAQRITGTVIDPAASAGIADARVTITPPGTTIVTADDGSFALEMAQPGPVTIVVSVAGFEPSRPLTVRVEGPETSVTIPYALHLEAEVSVTEPAAVRATANVLTSREVLATAGALEDVSRMLQGAPGIASSQDDRNDLIVRGGAPMETLFRVDGFDVPSINHFAAQGGTGGGLGVIAPWLIDRVAVEPGGFSVGFGERASGIVDIRIRGGAAPLAGVVGAGAGGAMLAGSGPIRSGGGWVASVRRSLLEVVLSREDARAVPHYTDALLKIEAGPARSRVTFLALAGRDSVLVESARDRDSQIDDRQRLTTAGVRLDSRWNDRTSTLLLVSGGANAIDAVGRDGEEIEGIDRSTEREIRARAEIRHRLRSGVSAEAGVAVKRASVDFDLFRGSFRNFFGVLVPSLRVQREIAFVDSAAFAELTARLAPRLRVVAGLRADRHGSSGHTYGSPRGRLELDVTSAWRAHAAWGVYRQAIPYIWIGSHPANADLPPIASEQVLAGVRGGVPGGGRLLVEAFDKRYRGYPVDPVEPHLVLASAATDFEAPFVGALSTAGRLRARGVDTAWRRDFGTRLMVEGGWSWWRVTQAGLDRIWRRAEYDIRHQARLQLLAKPVSRWEVAARWRYASGRAYTPFDVVASTRAGAGRFDGRLVNTATYPAYHRLDLRLDRHFVWDRRRLVVFADVNNAYDRDNVYIYRWNRTARNAEPLYQWGFTPAGGVRLEF